MTQAMLELINYLKYALKILLATLAAAVITLIFAVLSNLFIPYYSEFTELGLSGLISNSIAYFGIVGEIVNLITSFASIPEYFISESVGHMSMLSQVTFAMLSIVTYWINSQILKVLKRIFDSTERAHFSDIFCYLIIAPLAVVNAYSLNKIVVVIMSKIGYSISVALVFGMAFIGIAAAFFIKRMLGSKFSLIDAAMKLFLSILLIVLIYLVTLSIDCFPKMRLLSVTDNIFIIVMLIVSIIGLSICTTSLIFKVTSFK